MKGLAPKLLLLAFASVFALGVVEIGLRLVWHNPYAGEAADHVLKLPIHHAGSAHRIDRSAIGGEPDSVWFRADGRSYVLPSFQHTDPDLTVAFLGGSTTANVVVQEKMRFHALVSELLGAATGKKVNTLNAGRSGGTLHDSINVFFNHVLADDPDVVVLLHATNDIGVLSADPTYRSRRGHVVGGGDLAKWIAQMGSARSSLLGMVRQAMTVTSAGAPPNRHSRKNNPAYRSPHEPYEARLRSFVHMAKSFGVEPVLLTQPLTDSTSDLQPDWADLGSQDLFNEVVRKVGAEEDATVIDLVRYLENEVPDWREGDRYFYDGMHVTDEGSEIFARAITQGLLRCCTGNE